ncbi:MAG: hypothetical protein KDE53_22605, partial [Caldilineaceae bacterium]|nr:hypothetical protein [Caldilineaceae bacterium]
MTNTNPDIDRWRRPEATSFSNGSAASPPLVGEILPAGNGDETLAIPIEHHPGPAPQVYSTSSDNGNRPAPRVADNTLLKPFLGAEGVRRLLATRIALDEALDRWWTNGEHAPTALLRDGLLALEAGHDLDEAQRSFLLRTALRTGRGIVTALHYQLDTDRTAFLLKEALLDTKRPFDPNLINSLRHHDEQSEEWLDFLEHDLAY